MRIEELVICVLAVTMVSSAAATDHFPFTEGIISEFERIPQSLGTYTAYFSGTAYVEGTTTRVRHFDDGLLQFWSETPDGDKLLHGFHDTSSVLWSPPILRIDEPLYVGKTWDVDSRSSDSITVHIHYEVTALGDVTVPAGTFNAFTIRENLDFPTGGPAEKIQDQIRGIRGATDTAQQITDHSYADGIGEVLIAFGSRTDRLLSLRTVAVQPATWTGIQLLFR